MAPANASLVRSSDDGSGESDDDDDADVLQPWVKRRRYAAVAAPSRATRAERAVRERVVAAMRDRTITRDDAPEEEAREEETREEETREEPPTLSRNENNQWSFRESVPVFESNDDVVAKLRARAREMSEREKRSLILRARAERGRRGRRRLTSAPLLVPPSARSDVSDGDLEMFAASRVDGYALCRA